mmetsp:Transcript_34434/g.75352  ORF Transcript_34434/g.75352 Transcript_34434/m.75352 type:complete len:392 (+) Transcript_34434:540-1715(+)
MRVENSLSSVGTAVLQDIHGISTSGFLDCLGDLRQLLGQVTSFVCRHVHESGKSQRLRNDDSMAGAHREQVQECQNASALIDLEARHLLAQNLGKNVGKIVLNTRHTPRRTRPIDGPQISCLREALLSVDVLQSIKKAALFVIAQLHLRVAAPLPDGARRQSCREHCRAEAVLVQLEVQPIHAFGQRLEGRSRGMNGIQAGVRLLREAKLLPLGEDGASQRVGGSLRRIRGATDVGPEVLPRELGRVPFHHVIKDGFSGLHIRGPHGHEEPVEDICLLPIMFNLGTVEPTPKLDQLTSLFSLTPQAIHFLGIHPQEFTTIHRVEHLATVQGFLPIDPELSFELVSWHIELIRLEDRGLGRNCVVVIVDEFLLVDHLRLQCPPLHNTQALLL